MPDDLRASRSETGARSLPGRLAQWFRPRPMPPARRLVLGLGNPGPEYAGTRHNAGFLVADAVARRAGITFAEERGPYTYAAGVWQGTPFAVARSVSLYMNHSGALVTKLLDHFRLSPEELLVVYDDLALEPGQLRLRARGGAGGHNGVQSITDALASANFPRLRIGIGSSFPRGHQVDYVLGPFPEEERPLMEAAADRAAEAALTFVHEGLDAAMNRYNER